MKDFQSPKKNQSSVNHISQNPAKSSSVNNFNILLLNLKREWSFPNAVEEEATKINKSKDEIVQLRIEPRKVSKNSWFMQLSRFMRFNFGASVANLSVAKISVFTPNFLQLIFFLLDQQRLL